MKIVEKIIEDNHLKLSVLIPYDLKDNIFRIEYEITDFKYNLGSIFQNYSLEKKIIIDGEVFDTWIFTKGNYEAKNTIIRDDQGANELTPGKIVTLEWSVLDIVGGYDQYISGDIKFIIDTNEIPRFSIKSETVDFRFRIYKKYIPPEPVIPDPEESKMVFYIPEGIPNIKKLFNNIDFNKVSSWKIITHDIYNNIIATSRKNIVTYCDQIRIHFINYLGEIDSINFNKVEITQETKSDTWTKSQRFPLDRSKGGTYRKHIISNEVYEAQTKAYGENEQYWLKEFENSPKAWIEMLLPNGFQASVEKEYIPIVISDVNILELKSKERYEYIVKIKFYMSNSNINLR